MMIIKIIRCLIFIQWLANYENLSLKDYNVKDYSWTQRKENIQLNKENINSIQNPMHT